jgi:hypothetical protein
MDNNFTLPDMSTEGSLTASKLVIDENKEIDLFELKDYLTAFVETYNGAENISSTVKFDGFKLTLGDNVLDMENSLTSDLEDNSVVEIKRRDGTLIIDVTETNERLYSLEQFKIASIDLNGNTAIIKNEENDDGEIIKTSIINSENEEIIDVTNLNQVAIDSKEFFDKGLQLRYDEETYTDENGNEATRILTKVVDKDDNVVLDATELEKLVGENGILVLNALLTTRVNNNEIAIGALEVKPVVTAVIKDDGISVSEIQVFKSGGDEEDTYIQVLDIDLYETRVANYPIATYKDVDGLLYLNRLSNPEVNDSDYDIELIYPIFETVVDEDGVITSKKIIEFKTQETTENLKISDFAKQVDLDALAASSDTSSLSDSIDTNTTNISDLTSKVDANTTNISDLTSKKSICRYSYDSSWAIDKENGVSFISSISDDSNNIQIEMNENLENYDISVKILNTDTNSFEYFDLLDFDLSQKIFKVENDDETINLNGGNYILFLNIDKY